MSNDLDCKVKALELRLELVRKQAVRGTIITAVGYGILVVFVFIYTTVLVNMLRNAATPDNLSAIVKTTIQERLPALRVKAVEYAKENTPKLVEHLATLPRAVIPSIEGRLKGLIDTQVDAMVVTVKGDLVPRMLKVLDDNAAAINLTAESLKDQSVADGLALLLVDEVESKLDEMVNDQFRHSCGEVRAQIDRVHELPLAKMTKQELAERKLLVGWVFLLEHGSVDSTYGNVVEKMGHAYEYLFHGFTSKIEGQSIEL